MDANTYYLKLMFILLDVYSLAVEIDAKKKKHAERNLIFEEKRQEVLKKTWL